MFVNLIQKLNLFNEWIFSPFDRTINALNVAEWVKDALIDSFHMLPFLLFIFFVIGFIEYFGAEKTQSLASKSAKSGPLFGSLLASFPQCGFSVIASTLYTKKLITRGTLIAVYLATSDEAIPILLAEPEKLNMVIPLIGVKIGIALIAGYLIDALFKAKSQLKTAEFQSPQAQTDTHDGCCNHKVTNAPRSVLWVHPLKHTANIFIFILAVTLILNYVVMSIGGEENLGKYLISNSPLQPVIMAFFGLVPNCAVSIAITLMYVKGAIGFGSVISGLCSSAGLGLLVLLKNNKDKKDSIFIILLLLACSIISGLIIRFIYN